MAINYRKSDYGINKYSPDIIYSGSDGDYSISLEDFLASDPSLTESDFKRWKQFSDADYRSTDRKDTLESKRILSIDQFAETELLSTESAEDEVLEELEPTSNSYTYVNALQVLNSCLTEVQKRRYLLYVRDGMTLRQIASHEGVGFSKIQKSINQAKEKIKKFLI